MRRLACLAFIATACFIPPGCARALSPTAPVEWDLSPEAELSYATLLLDQSIRHDDKQGVLEAADIFVRRAPRPQAFIDAAAWLMLNKYREEARALLEKGVRLNPGSLELHMLLSETWVEEQNPGRAVEVMQAFLKAHPRSELAKQELGILYVKIGRYAEADKLFSALPERLRNAFVRYCHAQALEGLNRSIDAIRQLRIAVKESPEFIDAWFALARALESAKQPEEASRIYARLLEQDPGNQETWLRLVELELRAGRTDKALEHARSGPETFSFKLATVTLFLDAKRYAEAESLLLPLAAEPDAPEEINFYLAAVAYEAHQDKAGTLRLLNRISPNNRFYDRALRLRAQILYEEGKTDEALAVVREGQKVFPSDRELRLMETHLLLAADRRSEALTAIEKALAEWPAERDMLFLRGSILDLLDRKQDALAVMEKLVSERPDDYQALNYVGYSLAESNKELDRALTLLERAVRLAPDQAYILDSLAWAQFRKGLLQDALDNIRRAVSLPGGEESAIWEHYGDIAAALGKKDEATRAWNKALTLDPEAPDAIRKKMETR